MSRLSLEDEFTDEVFTRGRAAWWNSFNVPGVNVVSDERIDVRTAFDRYLPWEINKTRLIDGETFNESPYFGLRRSDTGRILGVGSDTYTVVQNAEQRDLLAYALDGADYGVASIGALRHGATTFVSVDFGEELATARSESGQSIETYLALVNSNDGGGSLKPYATGIRPECLNTIDAGWLAGTSFGALRHTTNIHDRLPQLQAAIRQYLGLAPKVARAIDRLTSVTVSSEAYRRALEVCTPIPSAKVKDGKVVNAREITLAEKRRDEILDLAFNDDRVGFAGTLWGAFQTFSTYDQQVKGFRRVKDSGVSQRGQVILDRHFSGLQTSNDVKRFSLVSRALDLDLGVRATTGGLILAN